MNRGRRMALGVLAAAPLLGSLPAFATKVTGPINVVGFGSCGGRIVRQLAAGRNGVADGDFVAADDHDPRQGVPPFEVLGTMREPREGRPLVLVTGVRSRSRGEYASRRATEWSETRHAPVVPVVVLPFKWEGSYREHGIALAERFVQAFGTVSLIDNQSIDEQFLSHIDDIMLVDLWNRINEHAVAHLERVIAASRDA